MELIAVRIPDEMKEKLEKIAQEQHRPLSNLVRLILIQWLEQHEEASSEK
jgi:predicted DNA-binding protein